jgi:hypothetical protein
VVLNRGGLQSTPAIPTIALCVVSGLLLGVTVWVFRADSRGQNQQVSKPAGPPATLLYDKEKQQEVDLQILIAQLSEDNFEVRTAARKRITVLAEQSNENRSSVISELLKAVEMPAFKYQLPIPETRYYAALTLGLIGGEEARMVLSNALGIEQDPRVRKSIKDAIDAVDRGLKSN